MNILNSVSNITALVLTLIVFSGLFGRNFLFRIAESLLIGISAGYFAAVLLFSVLIPTFESAADDGQPWLVIPILLGFLLFLGCNAMAMALARGMKKMNLGFKSLLMGKKGAE